jgi:hypothetical protein
MYRVVKKETLEEIKDTINEAMDYWQPTSGGPDYRCAFCQQYVYFDRPMSHAHNCKGVKLIKDLEFILADT